MKQIQISAMITLSMACVAALAQHDLTHGCGVGCDQVAPAALAYPRPLDRVVADSSFIDRGGASLEDGSVIDILVVYTPLAATTAGGAAALEAEITLGLDSLNDSLSNSLVASTFRVVDTEEVVYTESGGLGLDLLRLRDPSDGFFDAVHDLRDQAMADLVMLVVNSGDVCGIGYIGLAPGNTPQPDLGFCVVSRPCMNGSVYAFAHEIGHNMGIRHGWDESPCDNGGSTFSKGYVEPNDTFMSMMGTGAAPRELYFSNPDVDVLGLPIGSPIGDPQEANAAAAIAIAAPLIAKYRNRDVNSNGVLDTDEITAGTLADCNANNYPDIGEQDFNRNGIPDECDIAAGTSLDADLDGVPDEVEIPVLMVDADAVGTETGNGWFNAKTDLQDALALARASGGDIDEIWIAEGTYFTATNGQRGHQFDLISGVSLRGGFDGTEVSIDDRADGIETILSADQLQNDLPGNINREDNSMHVLMLNRQTDRITLDRLIVEGGNADSNVNCGGFMEHGGGMFAFTGDIEIIDCEFRNNTAHIGAGLTISNFMKSRVTGSWIHHNDAIDGLFYGGSGTLDYRGYIGGVQLNTLVPTIDNQFIGNRVEFNSDTDSVSGMQILGGSPIFANNIIANNTSRSTISGSGLSIVLGVDVEVTNCTIANNTAPMSFGIRANGVASNRSQVILTNSILWGNHSGTDAPDEASQFSESGAGVVHSISNSIVQGWTGTLIGTGSTDADPLFADDAALDYSLLPGSGAIDMGDNTLLPLDHLDLDHDLDLSELLPIDFAGNDRQTDDPDTADTGVGGSPIVDAGALEYQPAGCVADFTGDGVLDIFDVFAFLNAFNSGDPSADFTGDGAHDIFDVFAFLNEFNAGCP